MSLSGKETNLQLTIFPNEKPKLAEIILVNPNSPNVPKSLLFLFFTVLKVIEPPVEGGGVGGFIRGGDRRRRRHRGAVVPLIDAHYFYYRAKFSATSLPPGRPQLY